MAKPPPLASERRQFPRVDVMAQVQCRTGGEVMVLQARNVSAGGVFLEGAAKDHPQLVVGVEVDLVLFTADAPETSIELVCKVVRHAKGDPATPPGFGLSITRVTPDNLAKLRTLVRAR
jgi:hypothetical protein